MKKTRYILIEETNGEQPVYGLAILKEDLSKNATELYRVGNITCNKADMEALVLRCNFLGLSPIHLDEVIDDFLLNQQK
ncbi:MAG: hypothetical protein IJW49_02650 [Clostridia bacterium]|nr:hypothetical protein [Clostridia bacterium]